jgi:hypothetical protein
VEGSVENVAGSSSSFCRADKEIGEFSHIFILFGEEPVAKRIDEGIWCDKADPYFVTYDAMVNQEESIGNVTVLCIQYAKHCIAHK